MESFDQDKRLVELVSVLARDQETLRLEVQLSIVEIELVMKLILDFWKGNNPAKDIVREKLQCILQRLEVRK